MSAFEASLCRRGFVGLGVAMLLPVSAQAASEVVYKVGTTSDGPPFSFLDLSTNSLQGIMIDVIKAIGAKEGFKPDIEAMPWSSLIPALTSGKISIVSAAMYDTPKRAEVIDFSKVVYSYGEGLFVRKSVTENYVSAKQLAGKVVGVQIGTAYEEPLKKLGVFKDIKIYDTIPDIMRDVEIGRIYAGFVDYPIVSYEIAKQFHGLRLVKSYKPMVVGHVAIAVQKGNTALLAKINDGIDKIKASGQLNAILTKWGI